MVALKLVTEYPSVAIHLYLQLVRTLIDQFLQGGALPIRQKLLPKKLEQLLLLRIPSWLIMCGSQSIACRGPRFGVFSVESNEAVLKFSNFYLELEKDTAM